MGKKIFSLLTIFTILWFGVGNVATQSTPAMDTITVSLFPDTNCERTCWQGLIPGESTSADVKDVLVELEDQLLFWFPHHSNDADNNEVDDVIQGSYRFVWKGDRNTIMSNNRNIITIENSIVDAIRLIPNEAIPIEDMLAVLGEPDDIRFVSEYQLYYLTFIYLDELLDVTYIIPESCRIATIEDDAEVWISYHNYEDASDLIETDYGLQPALLAYSFPESVERQVSLNILNTWLKSEDESNCFEAWQILPETIELPVFPSPEATELPVSTEEMRQGD